MAFDTIPTEDLTTAGGGTLTVLQTFQNNVSYIELVSGYGETWREDASESTRVVLCRWEDRYDLVRDFLGYSAWVPGQQAGGVQTNLSRIPPEQHPEDATLYAMDCDLLDGLGVPPTDTSDLAKTLTSLVDYGSESASMRDADSNMVRFALAKIAVRYATVPWDVYGDDDTPSDPAKVGTPQGELQRYIRRGWRPAAENITVPGTAFKFQIDGASVAQCPPLTLPTLALSYTWEQLPILNYQWFEPAVGKVNAAPFDSNYFPAGTLLLEAPEMTRYVTAARQVAYRVTMHMTYRRTGWNNYPHKAADPNGFGFYPIVSNDANAAPPYASYEFADLFKLPAN